MGRIGNAFKFPMTPRIRQPRPLPVCAGDVPRSVQRCGQPKRAVPNASKTASGAGVSRKRIRLAAKGGFPWLAQDSGTMVFF